MCCFIMFNTKSLLPQGAAMFMAVNNSYQNLSFIASSLLHTMMWN